MGERSNALVDEQQLKMILGELADHLLYYAGRTGEPDSRVSAALGQAFDAGWRPAQGLAAARLRAYLNRERLAG